MNPQIAFRILALLALGATAFFVLFTTWACYDDEGYVLWTLIHHQQGHVLYQEIFTQYGPAFYVLDHSLRTLLPFAYTTDGQRWQTWFFWLSSMILLLGSLAFLARRMERASHPTPPLTTAVFAFGAIAFFWHQERLALEPGHPQIWCNLLLCTSLLLLSARVASRNQPFLGGMLGLQGALAGILIMIKPNAGIFLLAALPAGMIWTSARTTGWYRLADLAYTASLVLLPWVLSWEQLHSLDAAMLPLLVSISVLGIRFAAEAWVRTQVSSDSKGPDTSVRALASLLLGTAITVAFFVFWSMGRGVDLTMLKRGLLSQHGSLLSFYFHPAIRSPLGWVAGGCMGLAILGLAIRYVRFAKAHRLGGSASRFPTRRQWLVFFAIFAPMAVVINLLDALFPLVHGLMPRGCGEMLLALNPVILVGWLALRLEDLQGRAPSNAHSHSILLVTLAAIASIQPLIAFPVPGTQMSLGSLPTMLLLVDGFRLAWNELSVVRRILGPSLLYACVCAPMLVVGRNYLSRESLALPGAHRLRLDAEVTQQLRAVVDRAYDADVDSIAFRWHNRPSWYLWTQLPPPHCQLPPSWTYLISDSVQREQLAQYQRFERVLIVDEAYMPPVAPPQSVLHAAWKRAEVECNPAREFTFRIWTPERNALSTKQRTD